MERLKRVNVVLREVDIEWLKERAEELGISVSAYVRLMIRGKIEGGESGCWVKR